MAEASVLCLLPLQVGTLYTTSFRIDTRYLLDAITVPPELTLSNPFDTTADIYGIWLFSCDSDNPSIRTTLKFYELDVDFNLGDVIDITPEVEVLSPTQYLTVSVVSFGLSSSWEIPIGLSQQSSTFALTFTNESFVENNELAYERLLIDDGGSGYTHNDGNYVTLTHIDGEVVVFDLINTFVIPN